MVVVSFGVLSCIYGNRKLGPTVLASRWGIGNVASNFLQDFMCSYFQRKKCEAFDELLLHQ
jgi:hypothetical protein